MDSKTTHDTFDEAKKAAAELLERIEAQIDAMPLPEKWRDHLRTKINELREVYLESRLPRFALIGRRGAGKSSLVNALFGEEVAALGHVDAQTIHPEWRVLKGSGGSIELLDSRGLHEKLVENLEGDPALEALMTEFDRQPPDVLLYVVKATEADAAVHHELAALERVAAQLNNEIGSEAKTPIVVVLTRCDGISPMEVRLHVKPKPFETDNYQRKVNHIKDACQLVSERAQNVPGVEVLKTIPVTAYVNWVGRSQAQSDADLDHYDWRWNIDRLHTALFDELPRNALFEWVRVARIKRLQKKVARTIVEGFALAAATIAVLPTPVADTIPLMGLQGAMIYAVAQLSGARSTKGAVTECIGST